MTPAVPRRAATVLVLREEGPEVAVLLVRRGRGAPFMADAYVFPGGRVDEADAQGGAALATRRCALRELREEVGIDIADPAALRPFSHWITPSPEPRRFDTDFFLAALPPGQVVRLDEREVTDLLWLAPGAALERFARGALKLPPPTLCNLEELDGLLREAGAGPDLLGRLLARCGQRRPEAILPKLVPQGTSLAVVLPWDPAYAELPGEGLPAARPAHVRTHRCVLSSEGTWRTE